MVKYSMLKSSQQRKANRIKSKILEMYSLGMFPSYLAYFVSNLNLLTYSKEFVKGLEELCEHSIRTKGYYKKYPSVDKEVSSSCKEALDKMILKERG